MKCVLIVNKSESVLTFRRNLVAHLKNNGYEVIVISQDNERQSDILGLGVKFYCVQQDNRGLNPIATLHYWNQIRKILNEEKPNVAFSFQIKANTFGVFAAKAAGIKKIFAMVEGAGDVFIKQTVPWKLLRGAVCILYRIAFCLTDCVFFLNQEDKTEFVGRKLIQEGRSVVIPGIGVDLEHFAQKPLKSYNRFLMVARLHREKGVFEYCECARLVRQRFPEAEFDYLGPEREIKIADIQEYIDDGSIHYLGAVKDVRPFLENCTALILPSRYREGLPMSIMEAEAVGRCILTFDNVGCRDTVEDGYNGFLLRPKDVAGLAEKCCYLLENPDKADCMGENSRLFAEKHFDQEKINVEIIKIIERYIFR